MSSHWFSSTRHWALSLTHHLSQTNTPGERDFPAHLHALLAQLPYFRRHPEYIRLQPTTADPFERYVLLALVRGIGPPTLILTGHYDVVGVENYGSLADVAAQPEALLPRLVASLRSAAAQGDGLSPADQLALDALLSGDFLPGRGLLDMKSGLAAGLAVLEHFAQFPADQRRGSLLFIAVPDEEIASHGARSAVTLLPALAAEWDLSFEAAINLDASDDPGDGSLGQAIYLGSTGKLLPSALLIGRETHAGSPFSGVNSALLAAELTRRVECNLALADHAAGEWTAPPTCLKQADDKTHYDVTTPVTTWCYYNWLTFQRPAAKVLAQLTGLARQALAAALESLRLAAGEFAQRSAQAIPSLEWPLQVYTYAEVRSLAAQRHGALVHLDELERRLSADPAMNTPEISRRLTEAAWSLSGLAGPAAVVGFAALYYPPIALDGVASTRAARLRAVLEAQAAAVGQSHQTSIALRPYFPGISDISFFSSQVAAPDVDLLAGSTPAWRSRASFDYAVAAALDLPVVNIGPWGRDYHQRLERLHTPYSFVVLPELLWRIALALFSA